VTAPRRADLRLLRGGAAPERVAGVQLWWGPASRPPFSPQVIVREEDRWLVLSARVELPAVEPHPIRVMTALWEARPRAAGSVVLRRGAPPELLAVVHDLDATPTCREAWVEEALAAALATASRRRWRTLAMEPLGCLHGPLAPSRFAQLLHRLLVAGRGEGPERLWVMAHRPE